MPEKNVHESVVKVEITALEVEQQKWKKHKIDNNCKSEMWRLQKAKA